VAALGYAPSGAPSAATGWIAPALPGAFHSFDYLVGCTSNGCGTVSASAFAVDGAESSHGADLRMWRNAPNGPQGPMQVTSAAAIDVGGGDRFDVGENRALGRAYLARMFRRYGNWPDAIAAYNWGPSSLDAWIAAGRGTDSFPLEVERYRDRVLRDAALAQTDLMMLTRGWPFRGPAAGEPPPMASELV